MDSKKKIDIHHIMCDNNVTMLQSSVLILDDDHKYAKKLADILEGLFQVDICYSEESFREFYTIGRYDLLIMDMRLKDGYEGLELLRELLEQDPTQPAIIMTAYADLVTYTDALESGALTYLDKREFSPVLIARTVEAIIQQGQLRKRLVAVEQHLEKAEPIELVGASSAIKKVRKKLIQTAEDGNVPVLITGEPGTDKDLIARNIHRLSRRRSDGPLILATWGHSQPDVGLRRLLGFYRQSGNTRSEETKGWLDDAKRGVLFIHFMDKIDRALLAELTGIIETGTFKRFGGDKLLESDVQVILSVTNSDLKISSINMIRSELARLGGADIHIPPLRERTEDITLIAQYTLQNLYRRGRTKVRSFRGNTVAQLESMVWRGNDRELRLTIEYAAILADAMKTLEIGPEHLPQYPSGTSKKNRNITGTLDYQINIARAEISLVESAIEQFETTKKGELAMKLNYNDRFIFSRRIRSNFKAFPHLKREFPKTAKLF